MKIYAVYRDEDESGILVETKELANALCDLGVFHWYREIFITDFSMVKALALNTYKMWRDEGCCSLSDDELKEKITEKSKGVITY